MKRPNLFEFATSELSQDAMLCLMAAWGNPAVRDLDSALHHRYGLKESTTGLDDLTS